MGSGEIATTIGGHVKLPKWPFLLQVHVRRCLNRIKNCENHGERLVWSWRAEGAFETLCILGIIYGSGCKILFELATELVKQPDMLKGPDFLVPDEESEVGSIVSRVERMCTDNGTKTTAKYLERVYHKIQEAMHEETDEERNPWRNHPVSAGEGNDELFDDPKTRPGRGV
ncbi:MAG: hypothetical protein ILO43_00645, partial [Clostridia bacterium]|nr:hypothetical protein [Clostridia bacterium]